MPVYINPNETVVLSASGSYEIEATWNAPNGAPPPKVLILRIGGSTEWSAPTGSTISGMGASNGLGHPCTTGSNGWSDWGKCNGVKYEKFDSSSGLVRHTVTQSATVAVTTNSLTGGFVFAGHGYGAEAIPVDIASTGGIITGGVQRYLIGQQVGATLTTGGLTQSGWRWDVAGGEAFGGWTATQATTTYNSFYNDRSQTLTCYFKYPDSGGARVDCFAHLAVPAGELPAAGLDVSVSKDCEVFGPASIILNAYIVRNAGQYPGPEVIYQPGYPANGVGLYGANSTLVGGGTPTEMAFAGLNYAPYYTPSIGILWYGRVNTVIASPNPWGGYGGWNYVQTVKGNRHRVNKGVRQENGENSPNEKLDALYPYAAPYNENGYSPETFSADNYRGVAGDRPADTLDFQLTELEIGEAFGTWMMYRPPGLGSVFVPLRKIKWSWYGKARKPDTPSYPNYRDWLTSDLVASDSSWSFDGGDFPSFPLWSEYSGPLLKTWTPNVP